MTREELDKRTDRELNELCTEHIFRLERRDDGVWQTAERETDPGWKSRWYMRDPIPACSDPTASGSVLVWVRSWDFSSVQRFGEVLEEQVRSRVGGIEWPALYLEVLPRDIAIAALVAMGIA